jgi:hypothetical protein
MTVWLGMRDSFTLRRERLSSFERPEHWSFLFRILIPHQRSNYEKTKTPLKECFTFSWLGMRDSVALCRDRRSHIRSDVSHFSDSILTLS